jgi:hypothetical protein
MMHRFAALVAGVAVLLAVGIASPDVPNPSLCTAPTPSLDALNAAILGPAASPVPSPTPGLLPSGTPANPATIAAVTGVIQELIACYNAGEPLKTFALYTAGYLRSTFARQNGFTLQQYDSDATPEPEDPARWSEILDIHGVRLLSPDRVGAVVTIKYADVPVNKTFFFTFERIAGRWKIDGILGELGFSVP